MTTGNRIIRGFFANDAVRFAYHILRIISCIVIFLVTDAAAASLNEQLLEAARLGNFASAQTLLARGADVNAKDKNEETPLIMAAKAGDSETVKLLLDKGADANASRREEPVPCMPPRWTAIEWAARKGHSNVVKVLLDRGVTPSDEALLLAVRSNVIETVRMLLDKGASVNAKGHMEKLPMQHAGFPYPEQASEMTALMWAIYWGHTPVVKLLLNQGADLEVKDGGGAKALILACLKQRPEVMKLLIDKGVDVNARLWRGETALMSAAAIDNLKIVKLLVQNGADINAKDNTGKTALIIASENGHTQIVELLKAHGAKEKARKEAQ